jgi:hypothetical protein
MVAGCARSVFTGQLQKKQDSASAMEVHVARKVPGFDRWAGIAEPVLQSYRTGSCCRWARERNDFLIFLFGITQVSDVHAAERVLEIDQLNLQRERSTSVAFSLPRFFFLVRESR